MTLQIDACRLNKDKLCLCNNRARLRATNVKSAVTFDCHKTLADVLNFFNNGNIRDCRALIRSLKHKDIVILGSVAQ